MAVQVKQLGGSHYTVDGERKRPGDVFVVTDAVYEVFKFKFEKLADVTLPEPEPPMALPSNATAGALELIEAERVDWANINGTGKDGRILRKDVEEYLTRGDA